MGLPRGGHNDIGWSGASLVTADFPALSPATRATHAAESSTNSKATTVRTATTTSTTSSACVS